MYNQYKPNSDEEYMNGDQLQYFKEKLLAMRQEYNSMSIVRLNALSTSNRETNSDNGNGLTDVEILNEDNHSYIQKEIADALLRIENKSYGYCEDTSEEIGIRRLMANPIARYSIKAQEKRDKQQENLYRLQGYE
ncbi:MAG: TraR/DksA family transcriptional regulator [Rickettsiaceae bacterium H1]|nr:TraR/DksA family transcriptional regulator [Rickettsiaceae bacterium H1]